MLKPTGEALCYQTAVDTGWSHSIQKPSGWNTGAGWTLERATCVCSEPGAFLLVSVWVTVCVVAQKAPWLTTDQLQAKGSGSSSVVNSWFVLFNDQNVLLHLLSDAGRLYCRSLLFCWRNYKCYFTHSLLESSVTEWKRGTKFKLRSQNTKCNYVVLKHRVFVLQNKRT